MFRTSVKIECIEKTNLNLTIRFDGFHPFLFWANHKSHKPHFNLFYNFRLIKPCSQPQNQYDRRPVHEPAVKSNYCFWEWYPEMVAWGLKLLLFSNFIVWMSVYNNLFTISIIKILIRYNCYVMYLTSERIFRAWNLTNFHRKSFLLYNVMIFGALHQNYDVFPIHHSAMLRYDFWGHYFEITFWLYMGLSLHINDLKLA